MIEITLPNNPVAWAASRVGAKGHYNPRGADKTFTRWQIKSMYRGKPIEGYVYLKFWFFFPIPNSFSKKKREQVANGKLLPTNMDLTNLQKLYEDCLKEIVISDDRNVAQIHSSKAYAEKGKIVMRIYPKSEEQRFYTDANPV